MALKYLIALSIVCLTNSALVKTNDANYHSNMPKQNTDAQNYLEDQGTTDLSLEESRRHKEEEEEEDKFKSIIIHLKTAALMVKAILSPLLQVIGTIISIKMFFIAVAHFIVEKGYFLLSLKNYFKGKGAGFYKGPHHDLHYGHGGPSWWK